MAGVTQLSQSSGSCQVYDGAQKLILVLHSEVINYSWKYSGNYVGCKD